MTTGSGAGAALKRGTVVFLALAVLTIVEFFFGIMEGWNIGFIMVLAVAKAVLIVWYFMHIAELSRSYDESEEAT